MTLTQSFGRKSWLPRVPQYPQLTCTSITPNPGMPKSMLLKTMVLTQSFGRKSWLPRVPQYPQLTCTSTIPNPGTPKSMLLMTMTLTQSFGRKSWLPRVPQSPPVFTTGWQQAIPLNSLLLPSHDARTESERQCVRV